MGPGTQIGSDIDGEAINDRLGVSVSLSNDGSTIAIGAPDNDGNGPNSGHTRIYHLVLNADENSPLNLGGIRVTDPDGNLDTVQLNVDSGILNIDPRSGATVICGAK